MSSALARARKFFLRVLAVFLILQLVVAVGVIILSRLEQRRRRACRPADFPWITCPPITLEHRSDTAEVFMSGKPLFESLLADINDASEQIFVETFIWLNDNAGQRLRDALAAAADRGVSVYVLYDWSLSDKDLINGFFSKNVAVSEFRRPKPGISMLHPKNIIRDHRKLIVVDNTIAYTGGYNFGDRYLAWRDTHVRVEGGTVGEMANAFIDFWNQHCTPHLERLTTEPERSWDPHVLVHRNDPSLAIFPIRGIYLEAIDRSSERIWLTTPYFVPDRGFRNSLAEAAARGVDVRIILPEYSNHPLTDVLAHGMIGELLDAGAKVFLYRNFMVHAKTCLIDDAWCTIGTANIDRWSMLGNYEINLEIRSRKMNQQLASIFMLDIESCIEILPEQWHKRPLPMRARERILKTLAPLV